LVHNNLLTGLGRTYQLLNPEDLCLEPGAIYKKMKGVSIFL